MKKVTMQELADSLNVSRVTVWKVINNISGVSDNLRDLILNKAKEMGYFKAGHPIMDEKEDESYSFSSHHGQITVSVVVSRPESSAFWMNIIHQIAKKLDESNINLMYTYLPSKFTADYVLPAVLTNGTIHGMIILNVYDYHLFTMLNNLSIPKVFLDMVTSLTIDSITGDLFLLEGKSTVEEITDFIIQKGRTEIGFIGDIQYAKTNQNRYEGYVAAMVKNQIGIKKEYCLTKNIGIYTYQEEINEFLSSLPHMPQAFVCASDYVAHFLLKYLKEHSYRVPEDIAVSGYDNNTEYPGIAGNLTTVQVQTKELGKRLATQLLYRMDVTDSPYEVTYLHPKIIWGKSTDF
ncbi:LacI family DNA-binding transcriptional regulator [Lachnoclostridium sp.]|uniref:LacI family DNA-binding transcriptional regulator n=1 Tax=Lachnoclostridium sp. TaxID=2028282 RepID=UPI00289A236E|nr:LacI family DNA-binding transcriptional regulator [Lachnoclostridium sp.]